MGRRSRKDADFFPFYVKDGRTLTVLQQTYGLAGIGFFTNLMRLLSQTPNHYINIADESDRVFFFARIGTDEITGLEMLKTVVKTAKIHRILWEEHQVIYCPDLVDSLSDLYANRKTTPLSADDLLNTFSSPEKGISSLETPITSESNAKAEQSRAEKSKAEQSRRACAREDAAAPCSAQDLLEEIRRRIPDFHGPPDSIERYRQIMTENNLELDYVRFFVRWIRQQPGLKADGRAGYFNKRFGEQEGDYRVWSLQQAVRRERDPEPDKFEHSEEGLQVLEDFKGTKLGKSAAEETRNTGEPRASPEEDPIPFGDDASGGES